MSTHPIHVFSEIGKLKKFNGNCPGKELENLMPDYLERLLLMIVHLEDAQKNTTHLLKHFVTKVSKYFILNS